MHTSPSHMQLKVFCCEADCDGCQRPLWRHKNSALKRSGKPFWLNVLYVMLSQHEQRAYMIYSRKTVVRPFIATRSSAPTSSHRNSKHAYIFMLICFDRCYRSYIEKINLCQLPVYPQFTLKISKKRDLTSRFKIQTKSKQKKKYDMLVVRLVG